MNAFEALRKGWELAKNLIPLMVVILIFNFISGGILLGVMGVSPDANKISQVSGLVVGLLFVMMIAWGYLEGGIFSGIQSQIKTGQFQLNALPANSGKFFLRLITISILAGVIALIIWLLGAVLTGIIVSLGSNKNVFFNIMGAIIMSIAVIASIIISIPLLSSHYIAVVEDTGPISAIKKGFFLFRENAGRLFLLFLLLGIIFIAASSVTNLIGILLGKVRAAGVIIAVVNLILTSIVNAAIGIFSSSAIMSLILSLSSTGTDTISIETPSA